MGSSSSSNSSQRTDSTSTSIGVTGDNSGFLTNGNGNTYNITKTDHGLVDGLVDIWGDMTGNQSQLMSVMGDMATDNAQMVQGVANDAFNYAGDVNRDSLDFADSTVKNAFGFSDSMLSGALGFGNSAFDFAGQSQDRVFDAVNGSLNAAMAFANNSLDGNSNLASDSINAQNQIANLAMIENSDLARGVAQMSENMHGNNTAFANNAMMTTTGALEKANQGMSDLAYYSIDNNSNLAASLAGGAVDKISDAYSDAGDQTLLAHKQALQFAEHSTRSDGQQLAISANKSMTYIVIGLGGIAILALVMGRK